MNQYFDDVDLESFGFGGLNGPGAASHGQTKAKPTQEGVKIAVNCDNCGSPNVLTVEWPEAIVISTGHLPPGYKYQNGYIRPDIGCALCKRVVTPGITPDEATRWVKAGINARFVNAQQAQALAQRASHGMR